MRSQLEDLVICQLRRVIAVTSFQLRLASYKAKDLQQLVNKR
jgi:hypothetical protein